MQKPPVGNEVMGVIIQERQNKTQLCLFVSSEGGFAAVQGRPGESVVEVRKLSLHLES